VGTGPRDRATPGEASPSSSHLSIEICRDAVESSLLAAGIDRIRAYLLVLVTNKDITKVIGLILHKRSDGKYSRLGVFDIPSCSADRKKYPRMARGFLECNPEEVTIIRLRDCVHIGEGRANDTGFRYVRFLVLLCQVRRIRLR
jgi:hypothetical protein